MFGEVAEVHRQRPPLLPLTLTSTHSLYRRPRMAHTQNKLLILSRFYPLTKKFTFTWETRYKLLCKLLFFSNVALKEYMVGKESRGISLGKGIKRVHLHMRESPGDLRSRST